MKPITIGMLEDHVLFRKALKNYLSEQKELQVILQAGDIPELLQRLAASTPDILLADLFMPDLSGQDAIKVIRTEYPAIKILVLTISTDVDLVSDLLELGIHGYVSKASEPEELLQAIYTVAEGRIYRNGLFTEALYRSRQPMLRAEGEESFTVLNEREKMILRLLWEEKSNKEIADELFIGVRTVEKNRQEMKEKTGVKSTVGLLKFALMKKIITAGSTRSDLAR